MAEHGGHVVEFRFGEDSRGVAIGCGQETPAAQPPGTTRVRCVWGKPPNPWVIRYAWIALSFSNRYSGISRQPGKLASWSRVKYATGLGTYWSREYCPQSGVKGWRTLLHGWGIEPTRDGLPWIIGLGFVKEESLQYSSIFSTWFSTQLDQMIIAFIWPWQIWHGVLKHPFIDAYSPSTFRQVAM